MRRVIEIGEIEWFREEQEETNKMGHFNRERRTLGDFADMWSGGKKKRRWAEVKRWRLGAEGCRFENLDDNGVMKVAFLQLIMDCGVLKDRCEDIEGKILNVTERNNTWEVLWRKCFKSVFCQATYPHTRGEGLSLSSQTDSSANLKRTDTHLSQVRVVQMTLWWS